MMNQKARHRFLMCPPEFFSVEYEINPWMEGNVHQSRAETAREQWGALHRALLRHGDVALVHPAAGVPDLVFTANAGLVLGDRAVLSRFRHPQRQLEEPHFAAWFRGAGFEVTEMPADLYFEGAGDALFLRDSGLLALGHGFRTLPAAADYVARALDVEVLPLALVDPRFYHLDTCFCPLSGGHLLYYPPAFDAPSRAAIEAAVPANRRHAVSDQDAAWFACNAVDTGRVVVMNNATAELEQRLAAWGYCIERTPLDQFMLAGGAAKCLTLRLDEPRAAALARGGREPLRAMA